MIVKLVDQYNLSQLLNNSGNMSFSDILSVKQAGVDLSQTQPKLRLEIKLIKNNAELQLS